MIRTGAVSRRKRSSDMIGESFDDVSPSDSHEVHVLAVDDSLVDRKVIERLLKITSCKVTAVDSGRRALQFLGLDEDKSSVDFDLKGSSSFREIPVVIMSSENVLARIDSGGNESEGSDDGSGCGDDSTMAEVRVAVAMEQFGNLIKN
ncbi:hypothetical protein TEA_016402 [Camellia sinensis var. sinensis]|uniref:Response regulatory domain-containing protein n=1 Tax=Camellia sinensis var. sinensis TaxID=542762 RepID=A0A4S4EE28_CAMSN|nr:hypothetical protein TEA_016402 [Camellia sinensis var. sinensis]